MPNPYSSRPDYAFWRRAVSGRTPFGVDPVIDAPFAITPNDNVATAGSCFAQHISRALGERGFSYLVTEGSPSDPDYGVFPARFGNIYTAAQLLQLLQRAYSLFVPLDEAWRRPGGTWIDPFRPRASELGFASVADLVADREAHLAAVRNMFEQCDVFIFTLGLTEAWRRVSDGSVFPLAPGVLAEPDGDDYEFHNFTASEVEADLCSFLELLRTVNPNVRVILTVSPVPLVATYEDRHVLVSSAYSKAVLRVAAETVSRSRPEVAYFPSYEIVAGSHACGQFYHEDRREVSADAVAYVMSLFVKHYLREGTASRLYMHTEQPQAAEVAWSAELVRAQQAESVTCDELLLDAAE